MPVSQGSMKMGMPTSIWRADTVSGRGYRFSALLLSTLYSTLNAYQRKRKKKVLAVSTMSLPVSPLTSFLRVLSDFWYPCFSRNAMTLSRSRSSVLVAIDVVVASVVATDSSAVMPSGKSRPFLARPNRCADGTGCENGEATKPSPDAMREANASAASSRSDRKASVASSRAVVSASSWRSCLSSSGASWLRPRVARILYATLLAYPQLTRHARHSAMTLLIIILVGVGR
mmetsp:Transcript_19746/g.47897  ORF Transcript_19746/g.47897 Transcript_19746/m.47897 type:complete len:230 (-) Transcript_19746:66-755(-)